MHLCMTDDAMLKMLVECKTSIVLQSTLWYQIGITHIGIIQIVEGWHAETLLDVCSHREKRASEWINVHEKGWSKF